MKRLIFPQIEIPEHLEMVGNVDNGGAGNIFRVKDITGKILALKIVNSRWNEKEFCSISALRDLPAHQALTQVFQVGRLSDGRLFYTMEIADNISTTADSDYLPDSLANRISSSKLSFADILKIFIEVAEGVQHLHNNSLGHGDIKPENIIFVNGKPKLADFGTVSINNNSGTAGFSVDNPVSVADRDCYALAKTLYCVWSGLDVSEYPALPEQIDQQEAGMIRKIYHKGCSKIPKRRFVSVKEFINELQKIDKQFHSQSHSKKIIAASALFFCAASLFAIFFFTKHSPQKLVTPDVDHAEFALMQNTIQAVESLPEDLHGLRPFRKIFESLNKNDLTKLDPEKVQWFRNFYRDRDRLFVFHSQITAENDLTKRLILYQSLKYKELFESVNSRSMNFDHEFVHAVFRLK